MSFWNPETFCDIMAPIRWLNYIFGLTAVEIGGKRWRILSTIYRTVCITVYVYYFFFQSILTQGDWLMYQKIAYSLISGVDMTVAILSIILGGFNSTHACALQKRCMEIDDTLEFFGAKKNYKQSAREVIFYLVTWIALLIILLVTDFMWIYPEVSLSEAIDFSIMMHLPIMCTSVVELNFIVYVRCLTKKLRKMNRLMREALEVVSAERYDMKNSKPWNNVSRITVAMGYKNKNQFFQHLLESMKQAHLEIVRISRGINQYFCRQLLLELVVVFTVLTVSIYVAYFELSVIDMYEFEKVRLIILLGIWIILNSLKIIIINLVCSEITNQVYVMLQVIREIDNFFNNADLNHEVHQFSMQLYLHPMCFTACGFVCLNNKFTKSFFGTVTTYVVILIQMSSSPSAINSLKTETANETNLLAFLKN